MSKPKEVYSIRVDPDLLKKAKEENLNISAILHVFLEKYLKDRVCPICKQKVK